MEKCPPAHACRDAFERMSKATIQMCMNTPGYRLGPNADSSQFNRSVSTSNPDYMSLDRRQSEQYRSSVTRSINRRPPPQFDMDLHELFPEDLDMGIRPSSSLVRSQRKRHSQQRYGNQGRKNIPPEIIPRPQGSTNVPQRPRSTSGTSTTQQYQGQGQLSPHGESTGDSPSSYFGVNQNTFNPDFMSNMPGMEFLNNLGGNTGNVAMEASPISSMATMQGAVGSPGMGMNFEGLNDSTIGYEGFNHGAGFDFGVGMGLDFNMNQQTGWGDVQGGFDLDGFFFGGNGT
jgi:hypothetical protein